MDCMVTSGFSFEGYKIVKYCTNVISRHSFSELYMFKENEKFDGLFSNEYVAAVETLKKQALLVGGNAVIGVSPQFIYKGSLIFIVLSGTAVTVERA